MLSPYSCRKTVGHQECLAATLAQAFRITDFLAAPNSWEVAQFQCEALGLGSDGGPNVLRSPVQFGSRTCSNLMRNLVQFFERKAGLVFLR
jgi:hypothetical protein